MLWQELQGNNFHQGYQFFWESRTEQPGEALHKDCYYIVIEAPGKHGHIKLVLEKHHQEC